MQLYAPAAVAKSLSFHYAKEFHVRMILPILVLVLTATSPTMAAAGDKAKCRKVKDDIRYVQSRLRAGYTRAEGEKLEARLRKLRKTRRLVCR